MVKPKWLSQWTMSFRGNRPTTWQLHSSSSACGPNCSVQKWPVATVPGDTYKRRLPSANAASTLAGNFGALGNSWKLLSVSQPEEPHLVPSKNLHCYLAITVLPRLLLHFKKKFQFAIHNPRSSAVTFALWIRFAAGFNKGPTHVQGKSGNRLHCSSVVGPTKKESVVQTIFCSGE